MSPNTRNIISMMVCESFWGFQQNLILPATVLTLLLHNYGASNRTIGFIPAIEMGLITMPQILGTFLFRDHSTRKRNLILWHFVFVIPFLFLMGLLIIFAGRLGPGPTVFWLLTLFSFYILSMGIIISVWMNWLADIFEKSVRGRALGICFGVSSLTGAAGALISGHLVRNFNGGTAGFGALYIAAGIIACFSMASVCFVKESYPEKIPQHAPEKMLSKFMESLRDANFRAFLVGRTLLTGGLCAMPFIAVHYSSKDGGALPDHLIVSCGAAQTLSAAVSHIILGHIGDRIGHKFGIMAGGLLQTIALVSMMTGGTGAAFCILTYAASGVILAATWSSHSNILFETCPHEDRLAHITGANLIVSASLVLFPLAAGLIAENFGLQRLFLISLLFCVAAFSYLALMFRDPREKHP